MATFGNSYGSSYTSFSTLAPETAPAAEKVRRHPKYYLNGGDIHFLVENYIFRVHRYFFERESAVFREKLNIPPPPGANPRGSSDSNPIPLDDVREEDFSRFLWVFYNPKYSIYDANVDEWSSILKLSYDWRFAEVKRLSTRYLETFEIDPIQKIELYQLHEIDKRLLIPSYMALINRQEPLSIVEGRRLSLETALMIATARECARGKPLDSGKHSPTVASVNKESMVEIIKDVFGLKDATPSSPSLEPIYEGTGPGSFSATPMSPSKIVTSPPREGRDGVKSPTPKSKKHLPPAEELVPRHEESPTKPVTPSVPPYLSNLFSPPTPPGTIKQSSAPKEEEKEKSVDPKSTTGAAPTVTSAASTNAASKAGQSVNLRPPSSQRRQQLPPLEISGKETKPRKTDPPPQTTNQKPQPQTPSLTRKTSLPADPPPQSPMVAQSATTLAGSALRWLRGSKESKTSEVSSPQKDNHERKRTSSSSSRFQDHVTNTASGAGTTPSYEFNDSTTKPVLKDSSVSSVTQSETTASAAASKATPAASTRNEPATSEPTPKADSSQTAKAKKAAAKDAKLAAKDTSTTAQNDVPSIDVQAATPAALPESEDPMNTAAAPSTDTSAAAASADKPVESTAEAQAATAPASAAPVASAPAPAPSDEPSPPAAVASTTDTKQAEPEPVAPAPPPKGDAPAADAEASWDFGDGGSDTQKPEDAAASDSPELFEDAVHVQAVSDSDDDKPLATLPGKKKPSAAEKPASKSSADTQSKPVPATNSATGDVAATEGAKMAAEIKNADSVAASAEPTPAPNSSKDAPAPNADAASKLTKEDATPFEPTATGNTSTPVDESKAQPGQPTSEQPSTTKPESAPNAKVEEPKEVAKPSEAAAKTESSAKDVDAAQTTKPEDNAASSKKPELHIELKEGATSGAAEPTANSAVPLPTPDVEGGVQSSVPKHMQDADESGLTTEGSELGSRPASPLAQKTAGSGKKKSGSSKKKKNKP